MLSVPAIFELDDDGEATGCVYHYCCDDHASSSPQLGGFHFAKYKHGLCGDYIAGTTCYMCGEIVGDGPAPAPRANSGDSDGTLDETERANSNAHRHEYIQ